METPRAPEAMLAAVDRATLTPLVRRALQSESIDVVDWRVEQIRGGVGGGAGVGASAVYRFSGQARRGDEVQPWTMILKILYARAGGHPSGSHYWRREADVYQSRLLDILPGDIAAPRCFGVIDHVGESCWLWLEDVKDELGQWPLHRYGLAARNLGAFNATYLTGQPLPDQRWLSIDWIRSDLTDFAAQIGDFSASLESPLMRRFFPGDAGPRVSRLWAERKTFLAALDGLPQTLCHYDAFRRNLLTRRAGARDQTVLIDWAFLGAGPVGAEIASLVWISLFFWEIDARMATELDRVIFESYSEGLRDGGWRGAAQLVRLGYTASTAIRRLGTIGYILPVILDETRHAEIELVVGHSIGELADQVAAAGRLVEALADESRQLINAI